VLFHKQTKATTIHVKAAIEANQLVKVAFSDTLCIHIFSIKCALLLKVLSITSGLCIAKMHTAAQQ
jgi:hypothetical protein